MEPTPPPSLSASAPVGRVATEGCSVLLDINDGDRLAFSRLNPNATVKIRNSTCSLAPLVGCPFGSLFRLDSGPDGPHLVRATPSSSASENGMEDDADIPCTDETRDNRCLVDNNTAQSLSGEDINAMRRNGVTGDDIVKALISNSSTYGNKTAFSQEKYKLKKQKKYAPKVLLRRPCTRSICDTYFKKDPVRIGFMRVDTLSLLLSMANVGAHSDVLIVDRVRGLVVGAVAERLGGTGYICSTYFGSTPNPIDIVRMYNFSDEVCSRIVQAPITDLRASNTCEGSEMEQNIESNVSSNLVCDAAQSIDEKEENKDSSEFAVTNDKHIDDHSDGKSSSELHVSSENPIRFEDFSSDCRGSGLTSTTQKSVKPGQRPSPEAIKSWKENGFTSLIIAAPELDIGSFIMDILPLLAYSAPFAIYHQYLQPLASCMQYLQTSTMAIGLQISEPWLREYQVLPSRTHPHMQMDAFGGYILSGIRICSNSNGNK